MSSIRHTLCTLGVAAILSFPASGNAFAQSAKDIAGTWTLVGVTIEEGGKTSQPFGPKPKGLAIIAGTNMVITITRGDVPKFATNNRATGTAEENKAAVVGSIAYFGTFTFNEADKSITVKIDGSSFPNWEGQEQKRTVSISGDTMIFANPTPSAGGPGGIAKITWKRAS